MHFFFSFPLPLSLSFPQSSYSYQNRLDVRAEGQVVVSPVCVVSKAHFLTRSGWMATDNSSSGISSDVELPFALARESGRTHLQVK